MTAAFPAAPTFVMREMGRMGRETEGGCGKVFQYATVAIGLAVAASMMTSALLQVARALDRKEIEGHRR